MIKLKDIAPIIIINGDNIKYVEFTSEEKQKRLNEINKAETNAVEEEEKTVKKQVALDKIKSNKNFEDLLTALGII